MNNNTQKAKALLLDGDYTLVAICNNEILTSHERGIKPLLKLLDINMNLKGYSVADKVIGKAAAFLYVLLETDEIYANVISESALDILTENHIKTNYEILTKAIRNRDNTGFCPMETAVIDTENADEALIRIRNTLISYPEPSATDQRQQDPRDNRPSHIYRRLHGRE